VVSDPAVVGSVSNLDILAPPLARFTKFAVQRPTRRKRAVSGTVSAGRYNTHPPSAR
jgi:hypothetical protein